MIYDLAVTVPQDTPATAPITEALPVYPGVVTGVSVLFPAGCAGLAHLQVWSAIHQVWPSNPGASFASDGETISWSEEYQVPGPPHELTIKAWNLDDTYPHTITIRIVVIPHKRLTPSGVVDYLRSRLMS